MDKFMNKLLLLLIFSMLLISCRTIEVAHSVKENTISESVFSQESDTTYTVPPDSSNFSVLLGHDSSGAIVPVKVVSYSESSRARLPKINITGNVLSVDCKCDSAAIYAKMYKSFKHDSITTSKYEQEPVIIYRITLRNKILISLAFIISLIATFYISKHGKK